MEINKDPLAVEGRASREQLLEAYRHENALFWELEENAGFIRPTAAMAHLKRLIAFYAGLEFLCHLDSLDRGKIRELVDTIKNPDPMSNDAWQGSFKGYFDHFLRFSIMEHFCDADIRKMQLLIAQLHLQIN